MAKRRAPKTFVTTSSGRITSTPTAIERIIFQADDENTARLALGEMADALLLASARVMPNKLTEAEYSFLYPTLEPALRHLLGK